MMKMSIDNAKKKTTKRMKKTDYPPEIDVFFCISKKISKKSITICQIILDFL